MTTAWPDQLRGITESVVTTLGPNELWNVAALGLHAPETVDEHDHSQEPRPVTARTWGRTRTWRNFSERGEGYIQFLKDPELFVAAALSIREIESPVLPEANAWVQVEVSRRTEGRSEGTQWVEWTLEPVDHGVTSRVVPTFNRGYAALIEATVHASRLGLAAYDSTQLREQIEYCETIVTRCGGPAEKRAFESLREAVDADL